MSSAFSKFLIGFYILLSRLLPQEGCAKTLFSKIAATFFLVSRADGRACRETFQIQQWQSAIANTLSAPACQQRLCAGCCRGTGGDHIVYQQARFLPSSKFRVCATRKAPATLARRCSKAAGPPDAALARVRPSACGYQRYPQWRWASGTAMSSRHIVAARSAGCRYGNDAGRTQGTCLRHKLREQLAVLHRPYASRCQRPALPARGPAPPPRHGLQHGILYAGCRAAHSPHTGTVLLHRSVPRNNAEKRPAAFPASCAALPAPRHNPGRSGTLPSTRSQNGQRRGYTSCLAPRRMRRGTL